MRTPVLVHTPRAQEPPGTLLRHSSNLTPCHQPPGDNFSRVPPVPACWHRHIRQLGCWGSSVSCRFSNPTDPVTHPGYPVLRNCHWKAAGCCWGRRCLPGEKVFGCQSAWRGAGQQPLFLGQTAGGCHVPRACVERRGALVPRAPPLRFGAVWDTLAAGTVLLPVPPQQGTATVCSSGCLVPGVLPQAVGQGGSMGLASCPSQD